ncbi:MAG: FAD-linked oxidase C-terminal domain-containing protein [Paracoccus sp. (in: a-proteobacteria)]|uniref:FAD-binding oxidoreductase n=1 Tax=Paracoccus sp. TaxID=267 RepID=UPI0026E075DE|nr:FAD-linked oxidase C-terminal domain-containing protein [Paracoccus sp. (in: a-proteobacteria)]MDO5621804.1 FAD-linked oxidase C-terminal domain-containing protein [Paracoccus sp. (in: a-proteobacteria)]
MPLPETALADLTALLGERFSQKPGDLSQHAASETFHRAPPPDAVAWPLNTTEVSAILKICNSHGVPVIGWGAGTSLEGHALAVKGGLVLDLTRMDRVLDIRPEDMLAIVQPGVTREALNTDLRATGLFFPIDPGANATLGGMAATRASGTTAVRYGTMRDNVLALEVVLADGRIIRTGTRAAKSSAGYDLTGLMVGSEGTLGIITELTLRLHGQPEEVAAAVCAFPTLESAVECVAMTMQTGIPMARIEFMDPMAMRAVNQFAGTDYPEEPHLMVEFTGAPASVKADAEAFGELAAECGGKGFAWATSEAERKKLWEARHNSYWATLRLRPGATGVVTDICVPMSELPAAVSAAAKDMAEAGIIGDIVGHVGDGNFHTLLLIDPDSPQELAQAKAVARRMAERALAVGGTISGEHGIGIGKRDLMEQQHGEAWALMGAIKATLDPNNILNPGKLVPDRN